MEQAVTVLLPHCTIHYIFYYLLKKFFDVFAYFNSVGSSCILSKYLEPWCSELPFPNKIYKKKWKINEVHYIEDERWNVIYFTPLFGKVKAQKMWNNSKKITGKLVSYSLVCHARYVCQPFIQELSKYFWCINASLLY